MKPIGILLLALALCALTVPAWGEGADGFSVVTGSSLWTFADPSSLDMFWPHNMSLPLKDQKAVSAAASSTLGGFVALGDSTVAAYNVSGFELAIDFGSSNYLLADAAFVPATDRVVAVGIEQGFFANTVAFFVSEDGGLTWATPQTTDSTESRRPGSISFGPGFGVAALGGRLYNTPDGKSWTSTYSATFQTMTKVAVLNSTHAVATGYELQATRSIPIGFISASTGDKWLSFTLPSFTPSGASISGIAPIDGNTWLLSTSGGEIWRTADCGKSWNRVLFASNASWADIAYNTNWKVLLAAGSFPLASGTPGILALSYDGGSTWAQSSPLPGVSFMRVVPDVPSAMQSPSPSPSFTPSASPSPSVPPSSSPSVAPSHSATPSSMASHSHTPTSSPSHGASPSNSPSRLPSHSPSPSFTPSPSQHHSASPSPTQHSATPSSSASPTKHSASPTPSASPSKHSAAPTPSTSPSASPSVHPKKENDGPNKQLALGLGLGLGLGGGAALVGGVAAYWLWKRNRARTHLYQPININQGDV